MKVFLLGSLIVLLILVAAAAFPSPAELQGVRDGQGTNAGKKVTKTQDTSEPHRKYHHSIQEPHQINSNQDDDGSDLEPTNIGGWSFITRSTNTRMKVTKRQDTLEPRRRYYRSIREPRQISSNEDYDGWDFDPTQIGGTSFITRSTNARIKVTKRQDTLEPRRRYYRSIREPRQIYSNEDYDGWDFDPTQIGGKSFITRMLLDSEEITEEKNKTNLSCFECCESNATLAQETPGAIKEGGQDVGLTHKNIIMTPATRVNLTDPLGREYNSTLDRCLGCCANVTANATYEKPEVRP